MTQMWGLRERGVKDTLRFWVRSSGRVELLLSETGRLCEEPMWGPYQELDCGHMKVEMLKASCWILNTRNAKAGEYPYLWFRGKDQARDAGQVISIPTILNVMRLDEIPEGVRVESPERRPRD